MEERTRFLKEKLIAHRGLHDIDKGVVENSLESFKLAIDKGYGIEIDVHITKDEKIVVYHDDNIKRLTDIDNVIEDMTYNEIKQIKLKNTESKIPTIEETLELVNGRVPLLIEIKNIRKVGKLEKTLAEILDNYKGQYAIQSFNPMSIYWFKKNRPEVLRGQLSSGFKNDKLYKRIFLKNMLLNFLTKPDFVSYSVNDLDPKKAEKIRKTKLLLGWTVRSYEAKEKFESYFDNLICEKIL